MAGAVDVESLDSLFAWVAGKGDHATASAPPAATPSRVKAEEGSAEEEEEEEGEAEQGEDPADEGEESEEEDAEVDDTTHVSDQDDEGSHHSMRCTLCHMTDNDDDLGDGGGAKTTFEYASQKRRFGPPVCDSCEGFLRYKLMVRARSGLDNMTLVQLSDTLHKLSWYLAMRRCGMDAKSSKVSNKALERNMALGADAQEILASLKNRRGLVGSAASGDVFMGVNDYVLRCGNPLNAGHTLMECIINGKVQVGVLVPAAEVKNKDNGRWDLKSTITGAWPKHKPMPKPIADMMRLKVDDLQALTDIKELIGGYIQHVSLVEQVAVVAPINPIHPPTLPIPSTSEGNRTIWLS